MKKLLCIITIICCFLLLAACTFNTDPSHIHDYTIVNYNENAHWLECECKDKTAVEFHRGGIATCADLAVCSVCSVEYGELESHNYVEKKNETHHWLECSCEDKKNEADHNHTILKFNEVEHWYECACGDKKNVEAHSGGTAAENEKAECSICSAKYDEIKKASEGLAFVSNGDGTCYVSGIGICSDIDLVIPAKSPTGDSVIAIGQGAFRGNTSIRSVSTGDRVVTIESYAFYECTSLTTLISSDSLISIQEYAFKNCYALSDLFIGKNFKEFPLTAFYFCNSLKNMQVSEQNPYYTSIDGSFYDKSVSTIIRYAVGKSDTHFEIPNTVKTIGSQSFYAADQLLSVDIPDSVTSIDSFAFESCESLISIKYHGTQEKWNSISKGYHWNYNTGNYTITYNHTSNIGNINETAWNSMLDIDNFENFTVKFYGNFLNGNEFLVFNKVEKNAVLTEGNVYTNSEEVVAMKTSFFNVVLSLLDDSKNFIYDNANNVYHSTTQIICDTSFQGRSVIITANNVVVTIDANNHLSSMSCNMKQEFDEQELNLVVTFEFSDYGTTQIVDTTQEAEKTYDEIIPLLENAFSNGKEQDYWNVKTFVDDTLVSEYNKDNSPSAEFTNAIFDIHSQQLVVAQILSQCTNSRFTLIIAEPKITITTTDCPEGIADLTFVIENEIIMSYAITAEGQDFKSIYTYDLDRDKSAYIGEYVLHHIERELITGDDATTYNLGEYYFGTVLSEQTIRARINNVTGNDFISYNFGNEVYVTCNFVILDNNTAVAHLDNDIDLFENGNATDVFYFDIVQINGQPCFVLNATLGNHNYAYYVVKAN